MAKDYKAKEIEVKWPEAAPLPDGKKEGDEFVSMVKFRLKPKGRACILEIDDVPIGETENEIGVESRPFELKDMFGDATEVA